MRDYIKLLWNNHKDEIVSKSLKNCHVEGLHSIMLNDTKEKRIRLYYLEPSSEISNLSSKDISNGEILLPLAFHAHHCQLGLKLIKGALTNWTVKEMHDDALAGFEMDRFIYKSEILEGELGFELDKKGCVLQTRNFNHLVLPYNDYILMDANEIHTVFTTGQTEAVAWLVYEGKEDENYKSVCWSSKSLHTAPQKPQLYQELTENEVRVILKDCNLI